MHSGCAKNAHNNNINNNIYNNVDSVKTTPNFKNEKGVKVPPTLEEVREFVKVKGLAVDAERFFYFYESNGWMVGKNIMKSWKAACWRWKEQTQSNIDKTKQVANKINSMDFFEPKK